MWRIAAAEDVGHGAVIEVATVDRVSAAGVKIDADAAVVKLASFDEPAEEIPDSPRLHHARSAVGKDAVEDLRLTGQPGRIAADDRCRGRRRRGDLLAFAIQI